MKNYQKWMGVKAEIHNTATIRSIKEGEIWWCAIGENVGVEIDGKSELFSRPVLIFKKFSRFGFLGIPLTTQRHTGSWYAHFRFQKRLEVAALSQARTISTARLYRKIGDIDDSDFAQIKNSFKNLLFP